MTRSMVRIHSGPSYLYDYTCLQVTACDRTLDAQGFRAVLSILFVLVRMLSGPDFGPSLGRLFLGCCPAEVFGLVGRYGVVPGGHRG